jgi:membrane protease YdiL (CAAX protease family)
MQRFCRHAEDAVSEEPQATPEASAPSASGGGWGEVAAVLAAGVFPNLANAIVSAFDPAPFPQAYWADTLSLTTYSACTAFIVLYLLHRGGEPWERFGLVWPQPSDVVLGPALMLLAWVIWEVRWELIGGFDRLPKANWFPKPALPIDYVMMVIKYTANSIAEELVTRAYLITRLEGLLKSQAAAVLLAAVAFASYHLYQRTDGLLDTLILGVVWGALYLVVRRVWPFIIAHTLWNIVIDLRR